MSARHRQFSVLPAALANISGDQNNASPSQPDHGSPLLVPAGRRPAPIGRTCTVRNRRRQWIVADGQVPANVPMCNSRAAWLTQLEVWRALNPQVLPSFHMSGKLFRLILTVLARYADGPTGRHCAVSNATVAAEVGCSRRSVTTARAIIAFSGYGVEVRRGSGSPDKPSHWWRTSVWHLISRRPTAAERRFFALPPSKRFPLKDPVGNHLPSEADTASRPKSHPQRRRTAGRHGPRDLHTQRIAGRLASAAAGLQARKGRHVVGQLCNALHASHLHLEAWSAATLIQALNFDMAQRGLSWPDRIEQPGAFLAARLRHLPARPISDATPAPPPISPTPRQPVALTEVGRAARERVRAYIAARRRP